MKTETLQGFVADNADPEAEIYHDDAAAYHDLPFNHAAVKHSINAVGWLLYGTERPDFGDISEKVCRGDSLILSWYDKIECGGTKEAFRAKRRNPMASSVAEGDSEKLNVQVVQFMAIIPYLVTKEDIQRVKVWMLRSLFGGMIAAVGSAATIVKLWP